MSLWLCTDHGLTGPMACCAKASRAQVEQTSPISYAKSAFFTGDRYILANPDGSPTRMEPDGLPMLITDVSDGIITVSTP